MACGDSSGRDFCIDEWAQRAIVPADRHDTRIHMNLTTQEKDKVLFRMAAAVLRCPSERGVRLNHPTVVAPINDLLLDDRLMVSVRQAWWMGMRLTTWLRSSHAGNRRNDT